MNICYWNIHKNEIVQCEDFNTFLVQMLAKKSVDLFCISEFNKFDERILFDNGYKLIDEVNCDVVKCYHKIGTSFTEIRVDDRYAVIKNKNLNALFVCVHSYDQINHNELKRVLCMENIKMEIDKHIEENGETKVFVFGDFNCMPYDEPVTNEDIFNCVLYRDLLKTKSGARERYYNPMLLLLSESSKIYGSYYNDSVKTKNLRWYLLDQLMMNKLANESIDYNSIELITKIDCISLLKNNKPNHEIYSDHLPLFFKIKED